jgi:hypothetical protein
MGFGLHAGWAIEGAVGSLQKVDATYLSPHVNMAARLETSSKQYGVPLLASQVRLNYVSPCPACVLCGRCGGWRCARRLCSRRCLDMLLALVVLNVRAGVCTGREEYLCICSLSLCVVINTVRERTGNHLTFG